MIAMFKKFSNISEIETRTFYYLCGFSLFLPISKAAGNIFLALSILGMIHRLYRKNDDVKIIFQKYKKIFVSIAALFVAVLISALTSGFIIQGLETFFKKYFFHIAILFPVFVIPKSENKIRTLFGLMLAGIFVVNFSVLIQAMQNLSAPVWRFGGIIGGMTQGSLISMFLPMYIIFAIHLKNILLKFLFSFFSIVGFLALILNGTRGVWLATLFLIPAVILIYAKNKLKYFVATIVTFTFIGGIFFVTPNLSERFSTITDTKMQSNSERLLMWQSAIDMFEDNPFFGVGYGQYKTAYQTKYISPDAKEKNLVHAHSNIFQMLGECGIVGLTAFLFMWGYLTYFSLRCWFKDKKFEWLLFFCVLWGLMLHGLTEFNFETSVPSKLFWYSLGLCIAYSNFNSSQKFDNGGNNF